MCVCMCVCVRLAQGAQQGSHMCGSHLYDNSKSTASLLFVWERCVSCFTRGIFEEQ